MFDLENNLIIRSTRSFQQLSIVSLSFYFNKINALFDLFKQPKYLVPRLFIINPSQHLKLPLEVREVQVLSGVAWITVVEEDIILTSRQKALLKLNQGIAVVSTLSDRPLVLVGWERKNLKSRVRAKSECCNRSNISPNNRKDK